MVKKDARLRKCLVEIANIKIIWMNPIIVLCRISMLVSMSFVWVNGSGLTNES